MKFAVVVNQKYLVMVEAQSHGGAEHVILDGIYYGVETCQAFTIDEMTTDVFKAFATECQTISYEEMLSKAKAYKETQDKIENQKAEIKEYEKALNVLLREIDNVKSNLRVCLHNGELCEQELKNIW